MKRIFNDLAASLPTTFDDNDEIILSADNLPTPPPELTSDQLYIRKGEMVYPYSYRVDSLDFNARQETYGYLGLLLLAVVFNRELDEVTVKLAHPASDVKSLKIEFGHRELQNLPAGYHTRPHGLVYFPSKTHRHPFDGCIDAQELPCFGLTNAKDDIETWDDFLSRDTVVCFGRDAGLVRFAELLLNIGQSGNDVREYNLEGEGGFRGVGVNSAEVRLWLPGGDFWEDIKWVTG